MAKEPRERDTRTPAEYYKLNTQAVEDLAGATEENSPKVPEEELKKYRRVSKFSIAGWVKICFIKWWFYAAVCFFFIWGLGTYVADLIDLLFITGIAIGIVTDMLTNNAIRFFAAYPGEYDKWMMFPKKAYYTFPLNIVYGWAIMYVVYTLYNVINYVVMSAAGITDSIPLGVEPIVFGIFSLAVDLLCIKIKRTAVSIVRDAKSSSL